MVGVSRFSPEEKVQIVLMALRTPEKLSELMREKGVSPVTFSRWKRTYTYGGMEALRSGGKLLDEEIRHQKEYYLQIIGKLFVELEIQKKRLEGTN